MTVTARDRLRAGAKPRMIAILLALLALSAVFARLGVWQLDRALAKGEARAAAAAAAEAHAAPAGLDTVLAPQTTFTGDLMGRHVTTVGEFGADQLLVPGRTYDGRTGALVLTPLRVASTGAVLPVVRGWVPSVDDPAATAPPPTGEVTVVGWLEVGEAAGQGGLPEGQTDAISPAELVNRWGGPTYSGYLVLDTVDADQAPGLVALGFPARDQGGVDWRNLGYALQWWLFGLFAVALWWRMLGDEAREGAAVEAGAGRGDDEPAPGAGPLPGGEEPVPGADSDAGESVRGR